MLTENFGQIIEVEKRIIFCPKSQATWKDFQKSSRVAKSLRQFAKDLRNCFQGARNFWADRESLVKLPKRFADISHHFSHDGEHVAKINTRSSWELEEY